MRKAKGEKGYCHLKLKFCASAHQFFFNNFNICFKPINRECPSFSLLRSLITVYMDIVLQHFGKTEKKRRFEGNHQALHTN